MSTPKNVYEAFNQEMDALTITADMPAVAVVGIMTRAAKRAQLVMDEELAPIGQRGAQGRPGRPRRRSHNDDHGTQIAHPSYNPEEIAHMDHKPRQGDHRYQCRYCNKSFVVATMTTHHENNAQCPEAQQAAYEREHRAQ